MDKVSSLSKRIGNYEFFRKRKYHFSIRGIFEDLIVYGNFDILFLIIVLVLLGMGLVMQFSSSYPNASQDPECGYNPFYYIKKQAVFAVVGVILMLAFSRIDYRFWYKVSIPVLVVTLAFLLIVFVLPQTNEGFYRWLKIGPVKFQPSEIAKFCLILQSAVLFDMYHREINSDRISKGRFAWRFSDTKVGRLIKESTYPTLLAFFMTCGFAGLVFLEHHLSGALIMFFIGVTMMYIGGVRKKLFVIGFVVFIVMGVIVCRTVMATRDSEGQNFITRILQDYMGERIIGWLDKDFEPLGQRWQTNHSLFAIGSGGFFGVGLGNSIQKYNYVSEPHNDFIFAVICEELGFIGASVIILLFVLLVWRGVLIGATAKNRFAGLLSIGISMQIGLQVLLNVAVATDSIPNTGIGLPFFSYGGTSLLVFLVQMGIVLSVSRTSKITNVKKSRKKSVPSQEKV